MSSFQLKLLAILSMTIDHVGRVFYPGEELFFILGRFAFPLFAFLIAEGARQTKNLSEYLLRLFLFACLSQIPFVITNQINDPTFSGANVLFTLFLGLLAIAAWEKTNTKSLQLASLLFCMTTAFIFQTDYASFGVLSVFFFYIFRKHPEKLIFSQVTIFSLLSTYSLVTDLVEMPGMRLNIWYYLPFAIFSLIFISIYSGRQGPKIKYFFYAFYPTHLLLIYLIHRYL